jgi:hypothetical protein
MRYLNATETILLTILYGLLGYLANGGTIHV